MFVLLLLLGTDTMTPATPMGDEFDGLAFAGEGAVSQGTGRLWITGEQGLRCASTLPTDGAIPKEEKISLRKKNRDITIK
jgi:hypothetical protein